MKALITYLYDFSLLVKAEIKRDLLYMKRYPLEIISFLFFMFLILVAIIYGMDTLLPGGKRVLDPGSGFDAERMILGYCLMQFVMATQMGWSGQIQNESQTGTLEQLSISGHSLGGVLLARGLAQLPRQIISFFLMVGCYILVFFLYHTLSLNSWLMTIANLCILAVGIFGISFIFAGITLLFKRVGFFFQIINFAFLGLFWQNRDTLSAPVMVVYDHFPLTVGMSRILSSMTNPARSTPFDLLTFALISVVSAAAGYVIFRWMEHKARNHGLLSQY